MFAPAIYTSGQMLEKSRKLASFCHFLPLPKRPFNTASVLRNSSRINDIRSGPHVSAASKQLVVGLAPQGDQKTGRCSLFPGEPFLRTLPSSSGLVRKTNIENPMKSKKVTVTRLQFRRKTPKLTSTRVGARRRTAG